jgi:hypothetical protein
VTQPLNAQQIGGRVGGLTAAARMTPAQRRTRAQRAQIVADERFLAEVDPEGKLTSEDRAAMLLSERKRRMAALTLRRWQTRQARKGAA